MTPPLLEQGLLSTLLGDDSADARDVAVVVAHPDDETIGIGAQLPRLEGITLVHVTDGAPRNLTDASRGGFATAQDYAAARRQELEAAVSLAGLSSDSLVGLGEPDQEAALALPQISRRLADLFRARRIAHVVTHAYEGGHPDHDATAFCVHMACRLGENSAPKTYEMPLYRSEGGAWVTQRFVSDPGLREIAVWLTDEQRALKRAMLDAHATQRAVTANFSLEVERFRLAPRYDFTTPPNGGDILYERYDWGMTGPRWQRLAAEAQSELIAAR